MVPMASTYEARKCPPNRPDIFARARERRLIVAGRRRYGRCSARRRDGERCGAHAIPSGTVCELHGGGAPQVRIAAEHHELQLKLLDAIETHRESGDFEDLCSITAAQRELATCAAKLEQLSELRRWLYAKRRRRRRQS